MDKMKQDTTSKSIQNTIQSIIEVITALNASPIDKQKIKTQLVNHPPYTLKMPTTEICNDLDLFYKSILNEVLFTLKDIEEIKEYSSLDNQEIICLLIESLTIISEDVDLYKLQSVKFYFTLLKDIISHENSSLLIRGFLNELTVIAFDKIEKKPFISKYYKEHLCDETKDKILSYSVFAMLSDAERDALYDKVDEYDSSDNFIEIWNLREASKKKNTEDKKEYSNAVCFHGLIDNYPIKQDNLCLIDVFIRDGFPIIKKHSIDKFRETLYDNVLLHKFASIMKSEDVKNYFSSFKEKEEKHIQDNYNKLIDYIEKNNDTISNVIAKEYVFPVFMYHSMKGITNNYQQIAINSNYKCFQIKIKDNRMETKEMIIENNKTEQKTIKMHKLLLDVSILLVGLHECNDFLRRYKATESINNVKTPRPKEGGEEFYNYIFNIAKLKEITEEQAELIWNEESWKNGILKSKFKNCTNGSSITLMETEEVYCIRS